jgi:putative N-acetylmannosamine-6-phosphate epimerase
MVKALSLQRIVVCQALHGESLVEVSCVSTVACHFPIDNGHSL